MTRRPFTWQELAIVIALLVQITGILVILAFKTIPPQNTSLFSSVSAGGVVATFLLWANYRFGSSGSAESKDAQLNALMQHLVELSRPAAPAERVVYAPAPADAPAAPTGTQISELQKNPPPNGGR